MSAQQFRRWKRAVRAALTMNVVALARGFVYRAPMTERDETSTIDDLLKRIDHLEKRLALLGDHLYSLSQDFMDHRATQAERLESAFDRIKNIEVCVFPNLLNDIES